MVLPALIPIALAAMAAGHIGVNLYNQHEQRKIYQMQEADYNRQAEDFRRNTGRDFAYGGLSAPGHARAAHAGINQSYASGIGTVLGAGSAALYGGATAGLYGKMGTYSRRN